MRGHIIYVAILFLHSLTLHLIPPLCIWKLKGYLGFQFGFSRSLISLGVLSILVDLHLKFFLSNFQTLMQRPLVVGARPGQCHTITVAALSRAALVDVRALPSPVPARVQSVPVAVCLSHCFSDSKFGFMV